MEDPTLVVLLSPRATIARWSVVMPANESLSQVRWFRLGQSPPDCLLHQRIISVIPKQYQWRLGIQRRLGHEARSQTAMRLRCVDQKRMAKEHCARSAGRSHLRKVGRGCIGCLRIATIDMPSSPAGASSRATLRCDPMRMRVGESFSLTSEKRNSINRARPFERMLTRHSR